MAKTGLPWRVTVRDWGIAPLPNLSVICRNFDLAWVMVRVFSMLAPNAHTTVHPHGRFVNSAMTSAMTSVATTRRSVNQPRQLRAREIGFDDRGVVLSRFRAGPGAPPAETAPPAPPPPPGH